MLLGNYSVLLKSPGRFLSGSTVSDARSNWNNAGSSRNEYTAAQWSKYAAKPIGYGPGSAWTWQIKSGQISSINQMTVAWTLGVVLGSPAAISVAMDVTFTMNVVRYAVGVIECHITPFTTLSPESLANAVWDSQTADHVQVGSFGEAVGAGSSLTSQGIRDAMTLAPTLVPVDDSIDTQLANITNNTNLIPAAL